MTRLSKVVYRRSTDELLGMSLRHYVALAYLRDVEQASQQLMCSIFGIDANNMVLLLNELEEAGHVERRRDPADRRRHIVELTAAGHGALAQAEDALEAIEDDVLAALGPEDRATLRDLLARALAGTG
ncbi:MAG: MarR family winged helix-turn-helix transcriptional regulator [Solirubrobacteraceae bacterium]